MTGRFLSNRYLSSSKIFIHNKIELFVNLLPCWCICLPSFCYVMFYFIWFFCILADLIDNHHRLVSLQDEVKTGPCVQVGKVDGELHRV